MSSANPATKIILDFPVDYSGRTVTEVIVRRPKGRDMRFFPKAGEGMSPEEIYPFYAQLISSAGQPLTEEFIDEMDMADINKVSEAVTGFLESRSRTTRARLRPVK
jgi:hypothetical protein